MKESIWGKSYSVLLRTVCIATIHCIWLLRSLLIDRWYLSAEDQIRNIAFIALSTMRDGLLHAPTPAAFCIGREFLRLLHRRVCNEDDSDHMNF